MQTHPANVNVQSAACQVLKLLSIIDQVKAGEVGGIEAVIAAMRTHPASEEVQSAACDAFWTIANDESNKVNAGAVGAVEAVVTAMLVHRNSFRVQLDACLALSTLLDGSSSNAAKARTAGAVEAVNRAVKTNASSKYFVDKGELVLAALQGMQ